MTALPPYSGELACCEKCDGADAHTKYHRQITGFDLERAAIHGAPSRAEFLARECARCGYQWAEACVDREALVRTREREDEINREWHEALRASRAAEDAARCYRCAGTGRMTAGFNTWICKTCGGSGTNPNAACETCKGHGSTQHGRDCTTCNGTRLKP